MSGRYKRKLCRNYALGHCPQGDQCKYLHSNNIPIQPTYPMAPTMMRPGGLNPNFSFPAIATGMPFTWPSMSPPLPSPEATGFNWGFSPFSPPAPTASSAHSQPPQFRPLSWRTTLCRHFAKNQGWCPLGDECGYIHDLALAAHVTHDIRFPDGSRPSDSRAGSKHSHCWAYVQGLCRVKDCPYLHPVAITLFVPHTPCLAWPNCTRGALCAYKHPEPLIPKVPELRMSPPAPMQPAQPPSPVQVIPSGTVQFYGTTYFPMQRGVQPPPPPPPTLPPPLPSPPQYYYSPAGRSVASGYSPYSPESVPFHSPYYEAVSSLPPSAAAVPRAFAGSDLDDFHRLAGLPKSTLPPIPEPTREHEADGVSEAKAPPTAPAEEFPYQPPPPGQRGHARRVSVAMKSKEESDAADAAAALPARSTRRESWQHHRQRDEPAHKSWPYAPDAFAGFAPQQSLQLML